jgi:exocyst complex component 2
VLNSKEAEAQQKRILEKVWANVEKATGEMKNVLLGMLRDETRSVEEQEKTIEWVSCTHFNCLVVSSSP